MAREKSGLSPAITDFLESLEGGETDSTDQNFTVSFQNLGQRYQTFQDNCESYYLLRLLQGLINAGASEIRIKTTRSTLHISVPGFQTAPPEWLNPSILAVCLNQPQLWSRGLHAVCAGILCTCNDKFEELIWSYGGEMLRGTACRTYDYEVLEGDPTSTELQIDIKKKRGYLFSSTTHEHSELATRMGASPVPVTLDKLLMTLRKPQPSSGKKSWYSPLTSPFILAEAEAGKQKPDDWKELSSDFGRPSAPDSWATFKWYCEPDGPYARLALTVSLEGTGLVCPVIDGVLGASFETPDLPGSISYIDAQDLDTDLSGLAIINPSPLTERLNLWYEPLLEKVRRQISEIEPVWDDSYPKYTVSEGIMAAGADPISAIVVVPVFALLRMTEASTSWLLFALKKQSLCAELRRQLQERLDARLG